MAPTVFTSACAAILLLTSLVYFEIHPLTQKHTLITSVWQFNSSDAAVTTRHGRLHQSLYKRGLVVSSSLPTGWTSKGCLTDNVNSRSLYSAAYTDGSAMTEESCIAFCSNKGYAYAGVEYSQECCRSNF
jgi:hypothetical protein